MPHPRPRSKVRANRQAVRTGKRTVKQQVSKGRPKRTGSVKRRINRTA